MATSPVSDRVNLKKWQVACPDCGGPKTRKARVCFGCAPPLRGPLRHNWKGDHATAEAKRHRAQLLFPLAECEVCGASGVDRHHIDGNPGNNVPENIQVLCRKCHMVIDGRYEKIPKIGARSTRERSARMTHCKHGHELTEENTRLNGSRRSCIECGRNRDRARAIGDGTPITHCKHGHEFDDVNTWLDKHGHRHCRPCRALREQNRRDKIKATGCP